MGIKKIEWKKPELQYLGSSIAEFTFGRCETGASATSTSDLCNNGISAIVTCTNGTNAGAPAKCNYGNGVTQ